MSRFLCVFFALSALLIAPPAFSQSTDFASVLSGSKYPLSFKLKNLDASWRTLTVGGAGDIAGVYVTLLTGSAQLTYYTKGETLTLGGEVYLVTYHQKNTEDYIARLKSGSSDSPPPVKMTPDTELLLSLLNLKLVGGLNDIQSFSLQEALNPPDPPVPGAKTVSASNLTQIGLALTRYTKANNGLLPPLNGAAVAAKKLSPFVRSESTFRQPDTHELYQPNMSLSGRSLASFDSPSAMVIFFEASASPGDGLRAVLFLEGHVKCLAEDDWLRAKAASHISNPP